MKSMVQEFLILADLESEIEDSREDGDMEIITANVYYDPGNNSLGRWWIAVYDVDYDDQEEEYTIDCKHEEDMRNLLMGPPHLTTNRCAAIGDMDLDGQKEIVVCSYDTIWLWTYDETNADDNKFESEVEYELPVDNIIQGCVGPVLADIDNEGKLWAIVPCAFYDEDTDMNGKMIVLDRNGNEHSAFDAPDLPMDDAELFESSPNSSECGIAVADFHNRNIDDEGKLLIACDFSTPYIIKSDNRTPGVRPIGDVFSSTGFFPSIANIGTNDDDIFRVVAAEGEEDDFYIKGYKLDSENPSFSYEVTGKWATHAPSTIADLDLVSDNGVYTFKTPSILM